MAAPSVSPNPPTSTAPNPASATNPIFTALEAHPWRTDSEYQSGLLSILNLPTTNPTNPITDPITLTQQQQDLIVQVRCYYYSQKFNTPIDYAAYARWRAEQPVAELSPLETDVGSTAVDNGSSEGSVPEAEAAAEGESSTNGHRESETNTVATIEESTSNEPAAPASQPSSNAQPQYPASFAEIVHLITTGQPIPGIREIPDTVLTGHATQSQKSQRRKPWEKAAPPDESSSTVTSA